MKKILFTVVLLVIIFFLGKNLLPSNTAFDYHDSTQPARVKEFSFNLMNGQIPPRIAPNFSFNLGYPVFNYYAPLSYWIASGINLTGIDPINSIKISFLLTIIVSFSGMYLLANKFIGYPAGIIAGTLLASSPWMAVQIFIRGDLAEAWFIAFLPLTLYFLKKNSESNSRVVFLLTVFITSLLLTSHNVLSMISSGILAIYILIIGKKIIKNYFAYFLSFLLAGYFLLPALLELNLTHAIDIATKAGPYSNFLCLKQIWTGSWGYGASVPGCIDDGMAFMVGKLMIILGFLGSVWGLVNYKKIKNKLLFFSVVFLSILSVYMTIYESEIIWRIGHPILKLFQFSWRFLDFVVVTLSFLAGYLILNNKYLILKIFLIFLVIFNIFYNSKFFTKYPMSLQRLSKDMLSNEYLFNNVVYFVPEYLPKTASYKEWIKHQPQPEGIKYKIDPYLKKGPTVSKEFKPVTTIKDTFFYKESKTSSTGTHILNIHYMPYWKIYIDDKPFEPKKFDKLGRPLIQLKAPANIKIVYRQTAVQNAGNSITLFAITIMLAIAVNKTLWKKLTTRF